jgi:hypothetical protein
MVGAGLFKTAVTDVVPLWLHFRTMQLELRRITYRRGKQMNKFLLAFVIVTAQKDDYLGFTDTAMSPLFNIDV